MFFFYCYGDHRDLHSFPTRRSSDLQKLVPTGVYSGPPAIRRLADRHNDIVHWPGERPGGHFVAMEVPGVFAAEVDRKSTRLNSSHGYISYAVFCLKKKKSADPGGHP